jgi:hypothetical protein
MEDFGELQLPFSSEGEAADASHAVSAKIVPHVRSKEAIAEWHKAMLGRSTQPGRSKLQWGRYFGIEPTTTVALLAVAGLLVLALVLAEVGSMMFSASASGDRGTLRQLSGEELLRKMEEDAKPLLPGSIVLAFTLPPLKAAQIADDSPPNAQTSVGRRTYRDRPVRFTDPRRQNRGR